MDNITFEFVKASLESLPGMLDLLRLICETMENPEWFKAGEEDFFRSCLEESGFTIAARPVIGTEPEVLAGFFSVHFPGLGDHNMGRYLGMPDDGLLKVVHMDTAVVAPAYRGHHLQARMLDAAEEHLSHLPYRYLMATVHPDNHYSLQNMQSRGYRIVDTRNMYGGVVRHVLLKEI